MGQRHGKREVPKRALFPPEDSEGGLQRRRSIFAADAHDPRARRPMSLLAGASGNGSFAHGAAGNDDDEEDGTPRGGSGVAFEEDSDNRCKLFDARRTATADEASEPLGDLDMKQLEAMAGRVFTDQRQRDNKFIIYDHILASNDDAWIHFVSNCLRDKRFWKQYKRGLNKDRFHDVAIKTRHAGPPFQKMMLNAVHLKVHGKEMPMNIWDNLNMPQKNISMWFSHTFAVDMETYLASDLVGEAEEIYLAWFAENGRRGAVCNNFKG